MFYNLFFYLLLFKILGQINIFGAIVPSADCSNNPIRRHKPFSFKQMSTFETKPILTGFWSLVVTLRGVKRESRGSGSFCGYLKDTLSLLGNRHIPFLQLLDLLLKILMLVFQTLHWHLFLLTHSAKEKINMLRQRWWCWQVITNDLENVIMYNRG